MGSLIKKMSRWNKTITCRGENAFVNQKSGHEAHVAVHWAEKNLAIATSVLHIFFLVITFPHVPFCSQNLFSESESNSMLTMKDACLPPSNI